MSLVFGIRQQDVTSTLTVNPDFLHFDYSASTLYFDITSNVSWTITDNRTWISTDTSSGSGNSTIGVSVQSSTIDRTGTITVTGGGLTVYVDILQDNV